MRYMPLLFLILRITSTVQSYVSITCLDLHGMYTREKCLLTYNSLKEANYSSPSVYSKEDQALQGCIICLCNGHEGCCHVGLD
ncbi:hypothetical protein BJV82DRAFT_283184 [Fennellomyces sp. T-0311]|nr:hypothetical protein BJV82DRAFT_283184 [Fennellomyces sp. T-0311]